VIKVRLGTRFSGKLSNINTLAGKYIKGIIKNARGLVKTEVIVLLGSYLFQKI